METDEFLGCLVKEVFGKKELKSFQLVGGGCINTCYKLNIDTQTYFLKINDQSYADMFYQEALGLRSLGEGGYLRVPEPIHSGVSYGKSYLIMDYIESGPHAGDYWEKLALGLAYIHSISHENYGWYQANYIGKLPQSNEWSQSWVDFFINQRLAPQLKLAMDHQLLSPDDNRDFDKLCTHLDSLLIEEPPALLHGDLWSGNIMSDRHGSPCLVDPAIYFGQREVEIAFTTLFGGFDPKFYKAYREAFPLSEGLEERFDLYNLYPLLVHLNLFGRAYLNGIRDILRKFV